MFLILPIVATTTCWIILKDDKDVNKKILSIRLKIANLEK